MRTGISYKQKQITEVFVTIYTLNTYNTYFTPL